MSGMVMLPVVTTSETGDPDTVPYRAEAMTLILAGPPRMRPAMEAARLKKNLPPPIKEEKNYLTVCGKHRLQISDYMGVIR